MEFREILRLIIPLIGVIFGLTLRTSCEVQLLQFKKYWLFFVIAGVLIFIFRLYNYLK